jgi:hypothetical protein
MRIFLDDKRDAPDGLVCAYSPDEVIALLEIGDVIVVKQNRSNHMLGPDEG